MFILPTRGRPHNLKRLIDACHQTHILPFPWYVRVDDDDATLAAYRAVELPQNWTLIIGERKGCCEIFNEGFERHPDQSFYGRMCDDVLPESTEWDAVLISSAASDGHAYGDDGIQHEAMATHGVLGGDFVRSIGWLAPPGMKRVYDDRLLTDIARKRGVLRYHPDIKLTHLHVSAGKAPHDATYDKPEAVEDQRIYEQWLASPLLA